METGRPGERVPSKSDRSESSSDDSENGKRPRANSISEIPNDQTSDFTVYCAPCMRSGCVGRKMCQIRNDNQIRRRMTNTHVC